jgi:hypothetical protein
MQFVKGKPLGTQYATRPGARAKRREVALDRPGFEPGRICAWLSLRPSQGLKLRDAVQKCLSPVPEPEAGRFCFVSDAEVAKILVGECGSCVGALVQG